MTKYIGTEINIMTITGSDAICNAENITFLYLVDTIFYFV